MNQESTAKLRRSLIQHEGYEKFPYQDTIGKITIGIGYNLSDRGIDDEWINNQYESDVSFFYNKLLSFPWFIALSPDRKVVLIDMCFMGWRKFLTFNKMLNALAKGDYEIAADEMLKSRWAEQVKGRAEQLAAAMRTGEYKI